MADLAAFAGFLATATAIVVAIVAYAQHQQSRKLSEMCESLRNVGARLNMPERELPQPRLVEDHYAPDAVVDEDTVNREWQLPRNWGGRWDS